MMKKPLSSLTSSADVFQSVDELALSLGLGRDRTYRGLRTGEIPSIRVGKRFIIPRTAIAEWLRSAGGKVTAA